MDLGSSKALSGCIIHRHLHKRLSFSLPRLLPPPRRWPTDKRERERKGEIAAASNYYRLIHAKVRSSESSRGHRKDKTPVDAIRSIRLSNTRITLRHRRSVKTPVRNGSTPITKKKKVPSIRKDSFSRDRSGPIGRVNHVRLGETARFHFLRLI